MHRGSEQMNDYRALRITGKGVRALARAIFARVLGGRGGEMAYAEDLKFSGGQPPCGFESRPRHHDLRAIEGGKLVSSKQGMALLSVHWLLLKDQRKTADSLPL